MPKWQGSLGDMHVYTYMYMFIHVLLGACQNYGPFLGHWYSAAPSIYCDWGLPELMHGILGFFFRLKVSGTIAMISSWRE